MATVGDSRKTPATSVSGDEVLASVGDFPSITNGTSEATPAIDAELSPVLLTDTLERVASDKEVKSMSAAGATLQVSGASHVQEGNSANGKRAKATTAKSPLSEGRRAGRLRRLWANQYFAGAILSLLFLFVGIQVERFLSDREPLQIGDVGISNGFSIKANEIHCVEVPPVADPDEPRARKGPYKECTLSLTMVNGTHKASDLINEDYILYVGEDQFESEVGSQSSRSLFPNESASFAVKFVIPFGATPTSLTLRQGLEDLWDILPFPDNDLISYRL